MFEWVKPENRCDCEKPWWKPPTGPDWLRSLLTAYRKTLVLVVLAAWVFAFLFWASGARVEWRPVQGGAAPAKR